jgi:hypothetical protein
MRKADVGKHTPIISEDYRMNIFHHLWTGSRRLLRYRLRTLLLTVALLCVWLTICVRRAKEREVAVAAFRGVGGMLFYDFQERSGALHHDARPRAPQWLLSIFGVDFFYHVVYLEVSRKRYSRRYGTGAATVPPDLLRHLDAMPRIRILEISDDLATDEGLKHVSTLSVLEDLSMYGAPRVTDAGIRHLRSLKRLRGLGLRDSQVTDESLHTLQMLRSLEGLQLDGSDISDDGLAYLSGNTKLRDLLVAYSRRAITDRGMQYIGSLINLEELNISGAQVTSLGLEHLRGLKNLRLLYMAGNVGVTDRGMRCLAALPKLQELILANTSVTPDGLAQLKNLDKLRVLVLSGDARVNDEWMPQLAQLKSLEELYLSHTSVTSKGLLCLKELKKLRQLVIAGTAADRSAVQKALRGCFVDDYESIAEPGWWRPGKKLPDF